jgi:hypothetical protein
MQYLGRRHSECRLTAMSISTTIRVFVLPLTPIHWLTKRFKYLMQLNVIDAQVRARRGAADSAESFGDGKRFRIGTQHATLEGNTTPLTTSSRK